MNLMEHLGIEKAKTKKQCLRAKGNWRKRVPGVRKASCALPAKGTKKRRKANLAGIVKRGTKCAKNMKKVHWSTPTNPRVEACVLR